MYGERIMVPRILNEDEYLGIHRERDGEKTNRGKVKEQKVFFCDEQFCGKKILGTIFYEINGLRGETILLCPDCMKEMNGDGD